MPAAFTFNCPTEIEDAAEHYAEFQKAGAEVYIVTTDTHFSHKVWHETSVELNFETYISLSCHNCPDVVQALNLMAVLNPKIRHTMIDGALFQKEVEERQIMAVPTVYLNGEEFDQGRLELGQILAKVGSTGAAARDAKKLSEKTAFDVLVVGGGPAGAAAAIYAARKGIRTGVVAERFGGQVMETLGIENFISVPYRRRPQAGRFP